LDIFDHPAELAHARGTEAGDFRQAPAVPRDTVDCSAFAPSFAAPVEPFLVQIYLHVPAQAEEAASLAKESDAGATRRGRTSLATQIARGSSLAFELTCKHAEIDEPYQRTVWQGVTQSVSFFVTPPDSAGIALPLKIAVFQDRAPIGQIRFTMPLRQAQGGPAERTIVGEATRFRTAFASYASPDRAEVLRRVQMLRMVGVKCFQDVLDLEPGQRWEQQLWKHIDEADVLFLFWSQHAKSSKWVTEEWRYGLKRRGVDFIRPVVLQRQPFIEPPAELCELHFNDRVLSLIDDL
ncbi:MAG: toll/interleukin-1 receptor domain-containing protein, partial [Planctomycetaceae bacterium]